MKYPTYFRSSGFRQEAIIQTESGIPLDLQELPAFLRTLLVTDGTVTKSLEAWFWESIRVEPINNHLENLKTKVQGLDVYPGDKVLQREVTLTGQNTDTIYASARSTVSLNHLPNDIGVALENGEIGIGELLREKGIETYRDIFNINYFLKHNEDSLLAPLASDKILTRSYRIRVNSKAAIIVTEYFPVDIYQK